jgi:hypothetical protein
MVSLVDIVPQTRIVQLAEGGEIVLRGLGLRQVADLLLRFPQLRNLITEGAPDIELESLILMMPDAVGAVIAEAASQPEAADAIADKLPLDDVAACLLAVRDLTMPGGPIPFLDRVTRLMRAGADAPLGKAPDMNLPPTQNGSLPPDTTLAP